MLDSVKYTPRNKDHISRGEQKNNINQYFYYMILYDISTLPKIVISLIEIKKYN